SEKPNKSIFINDSNSDKIISDHRKKSQFLQHPNSIGYSKHRALHRVFLNVLGEQRIKELSGVVLVTMFYDKTGKILAVELYTKENTELSIEEFEGLIEAIKKDITLVLSSTGINEEGKFMPYVHGIHFSKLLNQMQR